MRMLSTGSCVSLFSLLPKAVAEIYYFPKRCLMVDGSLLEEAGEKGIGLATPIGSDFTC